MMNQLNTLPRRRYTAGPTPLHPLDRLSDTLGGPRIFMKRDDDLGLTGGGNKTRKLEFLVADALEAGADTLITTGAIQSNHCRLTLAAAVQEGLQCRLVLQERVPGSYDPSASGNNLLYHLLGAEEIQVVDQIDKAPEAMEAMARALEAQGRKGYVIPTGGSNPLGTMGYVLCAEEVASQALDQGLRIDHLVCASGSGGTHAGLLAGFHATRRSIPVTGISVSRLRDEQEPLVRDLTLESLGRLGVKEPLPGMAVRVRDDFLGAGYSLPTPEMVEAVKLLARKEGILLDPVYTGKAMSGLIGMIREGRFQEEENVVFLHTGGGPALFADPDLLLS